MTLREALAEGRRRLASAGLPDSALESELLLRHVLDASIVDIYLRYDETLCPEHEQAYFSLIQRRLAGEPSAYITGQREFYGLSFYVNPSVLIPRAETELLIEKSLELATQYQAPCIADIGTGSGVIAVILAKRLPRSRIFAVDISADALDTARRNARRHGVERRIEFIEGDLTAPLPEAVDIIVANLPYVKTTELPATGEPRLALDAGRQGLDVIRRLIEEMPSRMKSRVSLLLEIGQGQAAAVCGMLKEALPRSVVEVYDDLAGIARVVAATWRGSPL